MTKRELHQRVLYWQGVLVTLGVSHFRVETAIAANQEDMPGTRTSDAAVWTSSSYDSCKMTFSRARMGEMALLELDETIVHEWLHVAHRDLLEAIHSIDGQLLSPVFDLWDDRIDHEIEGFIERLARLITAMHGKVKL